MFNESEHPRDKDGKFADGKKQGLTKGENSVKISGGTSGGTSGATVDPNSKKGEEKAIALYDEIRSSDTDVEAIVTTVQTVASDLGASDADIQRIKEYLFLDSHELFDGFRRFDPDADIADSWLRLAAGTKHVLPHDITLIRHEIEEMKCIDSGMTQAEAHKLAQRKYNYKKECREYHGKAGKRKERR